MKRYKELLAVFVCPSSGVFKPIRAGILSGRFFSVASSSSVNYWEQPNVMMFPVERPAWAKTSQGLDVYDLTDEESALH
ncbi:hypothetical protein LSH36_88g02007 [Paralvinella palmiformis]|uniref:Uncharacterized protein n=1 Tax=Paralvinella palmiformis TaxID=53620 RepID=A0AAD9K1E1_9ANNE|nr:hypothetical protein LSH36_88g02007 [Paralvinella palmiformis]